MKTTIRNINSFYSRMANTTPEPLMYAVTGLYLIAVISLTILILI